MTPQAVDLARRSGERRVLAHWVRAATTPQRVVWRSRIALLALDGVPAKRIASSVGVSTPTVRLWIKRFALGGAAALLHDAPGRGRRAVLDPAVMLMKLRDAQLLGADGKPLSLRDAARVLGVSPSTVWRVLHRQGSRETDFM